MNTNNRIQLLILSAIFYGIAMIGWMFHKSSLIDTSLIQVILTMLLPVGAFGLTLFVLLKSNASESKVDLPESPES